MGVEHVGLVLSEARREDRRADSSCALSLEEISRCFLRVKWYFRDSGLEFAARDKKDEKEMLDRRS